MIEVIDICIQSLNSLHNPDEFKEIFDSTEAFTESKWFGRYTYIELEIPKIIDQGVV